MKKRCFLITLLILLCLLCAVCLTACGAVRSIEKTEIINGELVITYTDGTTENLGPVVGEQGPQGEAGVPGQDSVSQNSLGLDFYLQPDDTYCVAVGDAKYYDEIVIPSQYNSKAVNNIASGCSSVW